MMRHFLADRGEEIELFDRMVAGEIGECILLIESERGMGKSTLLREFERRCSFSTICVPVDFKGRLGLADAFYLLGRGLGLSRLLRFSERVGQIVQPERIDISRNWVIGQSEIRVALQSPDEETRQFRRAALTEAFFTDLASLERRIVFIFDTLNDAGPEARDWLIGSFLGYVRYSQNVIAVVGGRPPLEERTTWSARCVRTVLCGITDPVDWHAGLQRFDPSLCVSLEWIRAYCVCFDGHPLNVRQALEKAIQAGKVGGGR